MNLRRLHPEREADVAAVVDLFTRCGDYPLQTFGRLLCESERRQILAPSAFAPGCPEDHCFSFMVEDRGQPQGLLQVVRDSPQAGAARIALLLMAPASRRRHLGCHAVQALATKARAWGMHRLELAVLDSNPTGLAFWRHCGFTTLATDCRAPGIAGSGRAMVRTLRAKPACCGGHAEATDDLLLDRQRLGQAFMARHAAGR